MKGHLYEYLVDGRQLYLHPHAVWRDRADWVMQVKGDNDLSAELEQLWFRKIDNQEFELCCLLNWLYGFALGDVCRLDVDGKLARVRPSGRELWRFVRLDEILQLEEMVATFRELNLLSEGYGRKLACVDVPDEAAVDRLWIVVERWQKLHGLTFERGDLTYESQSSSSAKRS